MHLDYCHNHLLCVLFNKIFNSKCAGICLKHGMNLYEVLYYNCYLGENGYDFTGCNNVRDILCNTDVITSVAKLMVHKPVCKLIYVTNVLKI